MDGVEVEGRFLGVKHDKFNAPAGDAQIDLDPSFDRRSERSRHSQTAIQGTKVRLASALCLLFNAMYSTLADA